MVRVAALQGMQGMVIAVGVAQGLLLLLLLLCVPCRQAVSALFG
jgi:hypothetical protein